MFFLPLFAASLGTLLREPGCCSPPLCVSELGLPLLGSPHEELPPHPSVPPEASAELPASHKAIRDGWEGWKSPVSQHTGTEQAYGLTHSALINLTMCY